MALGYKKFCAVSSLLKKPRRVDDGIPPLGPRPSLCYAKVPGGRYRAGSAGRTATSNPPPQQPPLVVGSNPDTLMTNKPRTLSGTGLAHQGSSMVAELAGTLPSYFANLKIKMLIYQCFYFTNTAKKCHFWQFIAPFDSQLRQMAF